MAQSLHLNTLSFFFLFLLLYFFKFTQHYILPLINIFRYMITCNLYQIKVYVVSSSHPVRILSCTMDGGARHEKFIGIQLDPHNHSQLYSVSLKGTLRLWNFMNGTMLEVKCTQEKFISLNFFCMLFIFSFNPVEIPILNDYF